MSSIMYGLAAKVEAEVHASQTLCQTLERDK